MDPIRIAIVDDNLADLMVLEKALNGVQGFQVVSIFLAARDLLWHLENEPDRSRYQLVLLDVNMPVMDGITALEILMAMEVEFKIIMISHGFSNYTRLRINACKCEYYCSKELNALQSMISLAFTQEFALENQLNMHAWMANTRKENMLSKDEFYWKNILSHFEVELIKGIALGLTQQQLAAKHGLGTTTIKKYKKQILTKLKLLNTTHLASWANWQGLVSVDDF